MCIRDRVLGDGLKRTSGGRLEEILESLTSNKWKGALLGLSLIHIYYQKLKQIGKVRTFGESGTEKIRRLVWSVLFRLRVL